VGRIVGFDIGERRIGVAVSDASGTLARPLATLSVKALDTGALDAAVEQVTRLSVEDDSISHVVVGLPKRLDGTPNNLTKRVEQFARDLAERTHLPVSLQDERLSSHEAEERLALREKDWRVRKQRIDAAAAAIILQDYLDTLSAGR
jgi:putative holliday junction resolvase